MIELPGFVSSEQHKRTQEFDAVIWDVERAVAALAIAGTFPKHKLENFLRITRTYFLPNVRHGTIEIPSEYTHSESTPMLVANPDETGEYGESFIDQTPKQMENSLRVWSSMGLGQPSRREYARGLKEGAKRGFDNSEPLPPLTLENSAMVSAATTKFDFSDRPSVRRLLRPLMRLRSDNHPSINASVMYHESMHVAQFTVDPVFYDHDASDVSLRRELQAYDQGALFNNALLEADDYYDTYQMRSLDHTTQGVVDAISTVNPRDDRYAAGPAIRSTLARRGLRIMFSDK
jgi:hypothetical protein